MLQKITIFSDGAFFFCAGLGNKNEKFVEGQIYSNVELEKIFDYDVSIAIQDAKSLCKDLDINDEAVSIITHMCFQLGKPKTAKFKKMFEALRNKDYIEAGLQMEDSLWAKKHTPARASRLAEQMKKLIRKHRKRLTTAEEIKEIHDNRKKYQEEDLRAKMQRISNKLKEDGRL